MTSSKRKGSDFERWLAKRLSELLEDSFWKRVPGSGALGTQLRESLLAGDVYGYLRDDLREFAFVFESKYGYGGKNQVSFKRGWIEQAKENQQQRGPDFIPAIAFKFKEAKKNNTVICFELSDFVELLNRIVRLKDEYEIVVNDLNNIIEEKCND